MNIDEAKELVVKAGLELVESGLIARTWGNVSCRIDENCFVVTPSGRNYLSLKPDEIVTVNIADCSYSGDIKPSSEKGIHAEVYKLYPKINFIIHTHQENASVIGASVLNSIKVDEAFSCLGGEVICAAYALPGTKKLKGNVIDALNRSKGNAIIMKHHGALCLGKDYAETFLTASELEKSCHDFIIEQYLKLSSKDIYDPNEMNNFALSLNNKNKGEDNPTAFKNYCNSKRIRNGFVLYYDDGREIEIPLDKKNGSLPEETEIYNAIYKKYKDINHVIFENTPEISAISHYGISLRPVLDDFAQIAGTISKNVDNNPIKITDALEKSSVVFVKNRGALCCGKTTEDAVAVSMVTQKACKAYIRASLFGKVEPINPLECLIMRFIFLYRYSKLAEKKPLLL